MPRKDKEAKSQYHREYMRFRYNNDLEHKLKHLARVAVKDALDHNRLIKQNCSICGDTNSEAHHSDYSKPLDVIWLCRKCHLNLHNT